MLHKIPTFTPEKMQSLEKLADLPKPNYADRYRVWPALPHTVLTVLYQFGALLISNPLAYTQLVKKDISLHKLNEAFLQGEDLNVLLECKATQPTKTQEADCAARMTFYKSLPEINAGNGSNKGKGYLTFYYIIETALDHIVLDDILAIRSYLNAWIGMITYGTRWLTFPNGSSFSSDFVALQVLSIYITNHAHRFKSKDEAKSATLNLNLSGIDFCHPEVEKAIKKHFSSFPVPGLSDAKIITILSIETLGKQQNQITPINTVLSFLPLATLGAAARTSKKMREIVEQTEYHYIREGQAILDKNTKNILPYLIQDLKTKNGLLALGKGFLLIEDLKMWPKVLEYLLSHYGMIILEKKLLPMSWICKCSSAALLPFLSREGVMAFETKLIPLNLIDKTELLLLLIKEDKLQALKQGILTVESANLIPLDILKLLLPLLHQNLLTKEDIQEIILVPERDRLLNENKITLKPSYKERLTSFLKSPNEIEKLKADPHKIRRVLGLAIHEDKFERELPQAMFNIVLSYLPWKTKAAIARTSKTLSTFVKKNSDYKAYQTGQSLVKSDFKDSSIPHLFKSPKALTALGKGINSISELKKLNNSCKLALTEACLSDIGQDILKKKLLSVDQMLSADSLYRLLPFFTKEGVTVLEKQLIPLETFLKPNANPLTPLTQILEILIIKDKGQALQQKLITAKLAINVHYVLDKVLSLLHEKKLLPEDVSEIAQEQFFKQLDKITEIVNRNEMTYSTTVRGSSL